MNRRELLISLTAGAAGYAAVTAMPKVAFGAALAPRPSDPQRYGAGGWDDTAAVQAAVDAAGEGHTVWLYPQTIYEFRGGIRPARVEYPPGHPARYAL